MRFVVSVSSNVTAGVAVSVASGDAGGERVETVATVERLRLRRPTKVMHGDGCCGEPSIIAAVRSFRSMGYFRVSTRAVPIFWLHGL